MHLFIGIISSVSLLPAVWSLPFIYQKMTWLLKTQEELTEVYYSGVVNNCFILLCNGLIILYIPILLCLNISLTLKRSHLCVLSRDISAHSYLVLRSGEKILMLIHCHNFQVQKMRSQVQNAWLAKESQQRCWEDSLKPQVPCNGWGYYTLKYQVNGQHYTCR